MRRIAAFGMVAVLGLGLVACGSSKDSATTATTQSERLTATTPPSTAAPTTTTTTPSLAKLQGLLLTGAEVGPEWTLVPPTDGADDESSLPACLQRLADIAPGRHSADEQFDQPNGDYFVESIEFSGVDSIDREFVASTALFDACPAIELDIEGTVYPGTMVQVPVGGGDMSAAYRLTFPLPGATLTMVIGLFAVDGYAVSTAVGTITGDPAPVFDQLTAKAVAKVRAGAQTA